MSNHHPAGEKKHIFSLQHYRLHNQHETTRQQRCFGGMVGPLDRQALELELVKLKEQTEEMEQQLTDAQQVDPP